MENNNKIKTGAPGENERNPKLEMAALEITEILKKHDIAGVVQLYIPGFNKYAINIDPTFSLVSLNETGQLNIRKPIIDAADEGKHPAQAVETVKMLVNLRIYLGQMTMAITKAEIAVREYFGIKPPGGPVTPIKAN